MVGFGRLITASSTAANTSHLTASSATNSTAACASQFTAAYTSSSTAQNASALSWRTIPLGATGVGSCGRAWSGARP
jgi:hypothetical protein